MNQNILITTAISYTNGLPHIGHLYESILADFLNRVYKISGYNSKLLTGTDEHGKKIEDTATALGLKPKELCDKYSQEFRDMNRRILTNYDHFIRTTDLEHIQLVKYALEISNEANDIYKAVYIGWYNVREEVYISETQAREDNYIDTINGKPYERISESTYNFCLSKYMPDLSIVYPQEYRDSQRERLAYLKDISISRTTFQWGIPIPWETGHITYVWFDALLNYISGAYTLFGKDEYKPIHLIGKDIIWFHAVIYPAILKSCGWFKKAGPHRILVHGFVLDANGIKMSKSVGNVVNIDDLLVKYPVDAIRYYFIMNTIFGQDICFNADVLKSNYNNELIKSYGNLFQRFFNMVRPIQCDFNKVLDLDFSLRLHEPFLEDFLENLDFQAYRKKVAEYLDAANKKITDEKPWTLGLDNKIKCLIEIYYQWTKASILLWPIIPNKVEQLFGYLGIHFSIEQKVLGRINITLEEKIRAFDIIQ